MLLATILMAAACRPDETSRFRSHRQLTKGRSSSRPVVTDATVTESSMAPTLLGEHSVLRCPDCQQTYPTERTSSDLADRRSTCPGCGALHAFLFVRNRPGQTVRVRARSRDEPLQRWQIVVVHRAGQLRVKRLVGLPGERIAIRDGQVYRDGQMVHKSLSEWRRMAVPVTKFGPSDQRSLLQPAWSIGSGTWQLAAGRLAMAEGALRGTIRYEGRNIVGQRPARWLVWDDLVFNRTVSRTLNPVADILLDIDFQLVRPAAIRLVAQWDDSRWQLDCRADGGVTLSGDGITGSKGLHLVGQALGQGVTRFQGVQFGRCDGRIVVGHAWQPKLTVPFRASHDGVNGLRELTVEGWVERSEGVGKLLASPANSSALTLDRLRVWRDVYYAVPTDEGRGGPRRDPRGQVTLSESQAFVVGDNQAVSEDSRHWGPVPVDSILGTVETQLRRFSQASRSPDD